MCTLMTFDKTFWAINRRAVLRQIKDDAKSNPHGWALLCRSPDGNDDVMVQTMTLDHVINTLDDFFHSSGGRVWLHARFATGAYKGLPYCHGFIDGKGNHIMHNGMIKSDQRLDSYDLIPLADLSGETILTRLVVHNEFYANIFIIGESEYKVIRVEGGILHTDNKGNYSSHSIATINNPVDPLYAKEHMLPKKRFVSNPYWDNDSEWYPERRKPYVPTKVLIGAKK
jgi:hypothetical protein